MVLTERLKRRRLHRFFVYVTVFASLIGSGLLFYAAFFSSALRIQDIAVAGTETLNADLVKTVIEQRLAGKKWGIFPQRHFFFVRKTFWSAVLQEQFPKIASVSFRRKWRSNILEVRIRERTPSAVFCASAEENPCYFIDEKGVLYEDAFESEGNLLLEIFDRSGRTAGIGKRVLAGELMKFMKDLVSDLRPRVAASSFTIEEESLSANYLRIDTAGGWYIFVDTRQIPKDIAAAVKALLAEEIKENEKRLEYIDMRVEGRAYYKLR